MDPTLLTAELIEDAARLCLIALRFVVSVELLEALAVNNYVPIAVTEATTLTLA